MKDWFFGLENREQTAVLTAAVFVAFALFYFALWAPLDRSQQGLRQSVSTWERSLAELKPLIAGIQAGQRNPQASNSSRQSMVVIVDTTLRERSLYESLQRSQPTNANGIRVEFKDVPFDDMMRWLGDLNSRYAMRVQSGNFSLSTQNVPGRVNVSLTLER